MRTLEEHLALETEYKNLRLQLDSYNIEASSLLEDRHRAIASMSLSVVFAAAFGYASYITNNALKNISRFSAVASITMMVSSVCAANDVRKKTAALKASRAITNDLGEKVHEASNRYFEPHRPIIFPAAVDAYINDKTSTISPKQFGYITEYQGERS